PPEPWLSNVVAFSPGSVWHAAGPVGPVTPSTPSEVLDVGGIGIGILGAIPSVGHVEDFGSRDGFFAEAFDRKMPDKTQPDQWFRDDWPSKTQYITNTRLDRREIYTPQ